MKKANIFGSFIVVVIVFSSVYTISAWELDPGPGGSVVKKYAVIVGISDYEGDNDNANAVPDAIQFRDLLNNYYDYDEVVLVTDSDATRSNVREKVQEMASNADSNDAITFIFRGHANSFFYSMCLYDGLYGHYFFFQDLLNTEAPTIFTIVSCCHSGSYGDYLSQNEHLFPKYTKALIMSSCKDNELTESGGDGDFNDYIMANLKVNPYRSFESSFWDGYDSLYPYTSDDGGVIMNPQLYDGRPAIPFYIYP